MENNLYQQADGGSNPTPLLQLHFKKISSDSANKLFIAKHYAHRAVPISEAFGVYANESSVELLGAISFGKPASYTLCNGVCGKENSKRIYELNRLWLDDRCPKNSESKFIGWALRNIKTLHPDWIIVSYADSAQHHTGLIYRATNFLYTGKTKPHLLWDDGTGRHGRHIDCGGEKKPIQQSIKHRYVWFPNQQDIKLLKYPILKWESSKIKS